MTMHAVVSGWLLGPHSGANKRLLAVLAHAGAHLQADERITVLHRPGYEPPDLPRIEWLPVDIPASPTWRRAIAEQFRLKPLLRELHATVYDHGFLPPPRVPVPLALTIHDLRAADGHTIWPKWFARSVLRKACRRAAAIITPSEWTRDRLGELVRGAADRTLVAPNAVTWSEPSSELPRKIPHWGYLLHVGHLEPRKNLGIALQALARVRPEARPELWLVGHDAGAGAALARQADELGIATNVHHFGTVDDATLRALYEQANAVLMPSHYEGFGMPALEALSVGTRVLVADGTALPEVVADCGTVLPADQPDAWKDAIWSSGMDRTTPEMRREHARKFSWAETSGRIVSLWRELSCGGN